MKQFASIVKEEASGEGGVGGSLASSVKTRTFLMDTSGVSWPLSEAAHLAALLESVCAAPAREAEHRFPTPGRWRFHVCRAVRMSASLSLIEVPQGCGSLLTQENARWPEMGSEEGTQPSLKEFLFLS